MIALVHGGSADFLSRAWSSLFTRQHRGDSGSTTSYLAHHLMHSLLEGGSYPSNSFVSLGSRMFQFVRAH